VTKLGRNDTPSDKQMKQKRLARCGTSAMTIVIIGVLTACSQSEQAGFAVLHTGDPAPTEILVDHGTCEKLVITNREHSLDATAYCGASIGMRELTFKCANTTEVRTEKVELRAGTSSLVTFANKCRANPAHS
jgi:hypothetical protein